MYPGELRTFIFENVAIRMRWVPPGTFNFRQVPPLFNEKSNSIIEITRGFWMGETVLSIKQVLGILDKNVGERLSENEKNDNDMWRKKGDKHLEYYFNKEYPYDAISYDMALAICKVLTYIDTSFSKEKTFDPSMYKSNGFKKPEYLHKPQWRLPTECEWLLAALGPDINKRKGGYESTNPTPFNRTSETFFSKSFKPNSLGLYDMIGFVWQLCLDEHAYVDTLEYFGCFDDTTFIDPVHLFPNESRLSDDCVVRGGLDSASIQPRSRYVHHSVRKDQYPLHIPHRGSNRKHHHSDKVCLRLVRTEENQ